MMWTNQDGVAFPLRRRPDAKSCRRTTPKHNNTDFNVESTARTLFNAKPLSVASKRERGVFPLTRDQTWVASRLNPVYELGWDTQFRGPKFLPNSLTRLTWQFYCCVVNVLLRFQKWFQVRKITVWAVWPFFFPEFCMTFFPKRCAYPAYRRSI